MKVFEFMVIWHGKPTKEQREAGEDGGHKIVVDVQRVLAKDEKIAMMKAVQAIPVEYAEKLDQLEIACRPF